MVLDGIDEALPVLHPHAQGEWLGFDQNLLVIQQVKNITGGVARG